jgi:hypothetical protein
MKIHRERYQHGSIRRVKRAKGFAWEFRYYVEEGGKRTPKSQYFDGDVYKNAKSVRQKLEAQLLKLNEGTEYARANDVSSTPCSNATSPKRCHCGTRPRAPTPPLSIPISGHNGAARSSRRFDLRRSTHGFNRSLSLLSARDTSAA